MTRLATFALAAAITAGSLAALALPETLNSTIEGRAFAIDGDTLDVHGVRVRLSEIDAPERGQMCLDAARHPWACGEASRSAVQRMLADPAPVHCQVRSHDRYGRTVAVCGILERDIAEQLVRLGLAVIWPRYSTGRYEAVQTAAQCEHAGMWSGSFTMPWEWRHAQSR